MELWKIGHLISTVEWNLDLFLTLIYQADDFGNIISDSLNSEIHDLVFWFFQFQFHRNPFSSHFQIDLVQVINIQSNRLAILNVVSWSEHDRNLDGILGFSSVRCVDGQEYLSWVQFEI